MEIKIRALLNDMEAVTKQVLIKIDLDNSDLAKTIQMSYKNKQVVVAMKTYAKFVNSGRKAGSLPPIKSIIEFIKERNITSTDLSTEQLAWAIARSIQKKGIKPKPFINRLGYEISKVVNDHILIEMDKQLTKTFTQH